MRTASNVFAFRSTSPKAQPAKATLRAQTRAGVRRLIALAPVLGRVNPAEVPTVEDVMRNFIDPPSPTGIEKDGVEYRRTATNLRRAPRFRVAALQASDDPSIDDRLADARSTIESVSSQIARIDQILAARRRAQS